jgi:hypothetical protein
MTASTAVGISDLGLGYCNQHPLTADKGSKSTGSTAVFFCSEMRERERERKTKLLQKKPKKLLFMTMERDTSLCVHARVSKSEPVLLSTDTGVSTDAA